MSHSTLLRTLTSGEHNIADLPAKNMRMENTPRKVPFKDATNQSSMFKTPCRGLKNEIGKNKEIQAPKLSTETIQDFSCDFHPSMCGCFCNGDKKSDIEMIMDRRITPDFFELLMMDPLNSTDIYSDGGYDADEEPELKRMPSPIHVRTPQKDTDFKFPEIEFDEDFNLITKITNDSGFLHGMNETTEESNDEIVIPDFDFDFSMDDLKFSGDACDDSFIKQW